ncbi:MAG TPA: AraC family transcriptional regulator [Capsulimonadaceae bacterium]
MSLERAAIAPYIRLVHDFETPLGMTFGPAYTLDHALHYFKRGSGDYHLDGIDYKIASGVAFLVRPGVPFHFSSVAGSSLHMLNIHFDVIERTDSAATQAPYPQNGERRCFDEHEVIGSETADPHALPGRIEVASTADYEWHFARMLSCHGLQDMASFLQKRSAMLDLLALLYRASSSASADIKDTRHQQYVADAMRYIRAHFHEPIRLSDIADAASVSPSHLSAIFKAIHGTSPQKLVVHMRIEKAKAELTMGDTPVKEIARAAGFESIHHFTRSFTQNTGTSPARFRRMAAPAGR